MRGQSLLLDRIKENLNTAIALRSFMRLISQHRAATSHKIDNTEYAHVYNLICSSQQVNLLICLSRIWDRNADAISFTNLRQRTDWPALKNSLCGDRWEQARIDAADEFCRIVDDYIASDNFRAIVVSRTEGIAHLVEVARERKKMIEPRGAILRDLYSAVDISIEAANRADLAINSSNTAFELLQEDFDRISNEFFETLPDINEIRRHRLESDLR